MLQRAMIRRHPERAVIDSEAIAEILSRGVVAHVGIVEDGQPYVIPMTYHFDRSGPREVYLHGGHPSPLLKYLMSGAPVCIGVTIADGRVFADGAVPLAYEPIPDADLKATAFIVVEVEEWSAKVRTGGPKGPFDDDPHAPGTAGVTPLQRHGL